ncbi:hypothetical protein Hypma_008016 [Hypsizygus marmoreus]|uniref:YCII-related domain-containing protein n=1 Tax=Hypsizygus marmoreus TaxID=39966 RepID=A0A369K2V9_HYPMA|nr:hypothetical protein Hypma_008016 [Hypsizygus marmoreus]
MSVCRGAATSIFRSLSSHGNENLPYHSIHSNFRRMSTATSQPRFMVYAPDKTEEGTFERRLSVRPTHLETAKDRIENGFIRVGGVLLTPESIATPTSDKKMVGSVFICEAQNIEEVKKMVESDVYYTAGVWDPEKIVILPFIAATPIP